MTMDRMVEYLENRGFKAKKRYEKETKKYIFTIEDNDGFRVSDTYAYDPTSSGYGNHCRQEKFLDTLIMKHKEKKEQTMNLIDPHIITETPTFYFDTETMLLTTNNPYHVYGRYDLMATNEIIKKGIAAMNSYNKLPSIQKVIHNPPATIIFWADNTKTVVQTQNGEPYDPEKGFAMAVTKKVYGNKGNYFNTVKKWTENYEAVPEPICEPRLVYKVAVESADGTKSAVLPHDYASKSSANRRAKKLKAEYEDGMNVYVITVRKPEEKA